MPSIVKTTHAHDFLAVVPQLIGFDPQQSVVLVAFRGNRTCGAMRVDLPDVENPRLHKRIATTLIGMFCRIREADAIVPVLYTDASFAGRGLPHAPFAEALVSRATSAGFLVRDALCVAADGWGSYLDVACPPGGNLLDEIRNSTAPATLPPDALRSLAAPDEQARLPHTDPEERRRVARHLKIFRQVVGDPVFNDGLVAFNRRFDTVQLAESALALDIAELRPAAAAAVLYSLQAPPHRDQIMLQFAFGRAVGAETRDTNLIMLARQRFDGRSMDEIVSEDLSEGRVRGQDTADMMMGTSATRPDIERVESSIRLLKTLVALAPDEARPAPLCMLAWLSWALGRGSVAHIFVQQALAIDRYYGMARLLSTLFDSGHMPEWAFHK